MSLAEMVAITAPIKQAICPDATALPSPSNRRRSSSQGRLHKLDTEVHVLRKGRSAIARVEPAYVAHASLQTPDGGGVFTGLQTANLSYTWELLGYIASMCKSNMCALYQNMA